MTRDKILPIKIKTMKDLHANLRFIPLSALSDIDKRITDWLAAGGKIKDSYIKQQLRFAEHVANYVLEAKP